MRLVPLRDHGAAALRDAGAAVLTATPTMLAHLDPGLPLSMVVSAGEPLPPAVAAAWAPGRRLVNAYGPTEATVCATWADSDRSDDPVTIGRPVPNVRAYLLDEALNVVPFGAVGELHLAGGGVTRGYLGRAGLTAARYLPDPFAGDGGRMYRTGDLARWCADGSLAFLGRRDDQVKVRGVRVELGEIDAVLEGVDGVLAACAVVQDAGTPHARVEVVVLADHRFASTSPASDRRPGTPPAGVDGDDRPVRLASTGTLRDAMAEACRRQLPEVVRPAHFWWGRALPRSPSGKLDRAAVADLLRTATSDAPTGTLTPRERVVREVWESVLRRDIPDLDRSFFAYGGHSLTATRVVAALRRVASPRLSVSAVFQFTTVRELAAHLDTLEGGGV